MLIECVITFPRYLRHVAWKAGNSEDLLDISEVKTSQDMGKEPTDDNTMSSHLVFMLNPPARKYPFGQLLLKM